MTRPPNRVVIDWAGDRRFDAGRASGGPKVRIDADAQTGPGPVDALLIALGTCTAVDVVDILAKRRTPVESLAIEVIGERSSHTWFVLTYLLGYGNVRNYDGSWTEWGNAVRAPIEKGPEGGAAA